MGASMHGQITLADNPAPCVGKLQHKCLCRWGLLPVSGTMQPLIARSCALLVM